MKKYFFPTLSSNCLIVPCYGLQTLRFCILFLLFAVSLVACTVKKYDAELTISEKKMVNILLDLHVAEGAAGTLSGTVKDSISQIYYQQICDIYHISPTELHQNMEIMRSDPKLTFFLYTQVIDSLKSKDKSLQGAN
jgi:Domain of unknown function (DUF4296)